MDFKDILMAVKKSSRNWEGEFADGKMLLSKIKKKDPKFNKSQRARLRVFLDCQGNTRLLAVKDEPFSKQLECVNAIADEMAEKYKENRPKSFAMAFTFLMAITSHFEEMEKQARMEEIGNGIFERKIREPRRFELLSKSHNPYELYELGEISLKTEDYFNAEKAREFYTKAADAGLSDGLFTLGLYYELDEKDFEAAKNMYEALLTYDNPKGYTGLAILAKDSSENNPYYDLEKSMEMAKAGMDRRCGTSMYVLAASLMDSDLSKAREMATTASWMDENLKNQMIVSVEFIQSILNNLARSFPAFSKASASTVPAIFNDLLLYLYASKYNMVENYGRFLEGLDSIVQAIAAYYASEGKTITPGQVLEGLGIQKDLLAMLNSQYSVLDENSARWQNQLQDYLQASNLDA